MSSTIIVNKPPLRLASRLFLYGLHSGPGGQTRSAAAIGLLGSASFDLTHVYQPGTFGIWSGVCSATRAGTHWLLFLDRTGRAATGTINSDFGFDQAMA